MSASKETNSGRAPAMPTAGQGGGAVGREAEAAASDDGDEDEWRHEPVAPVDERNPLKSFGRAVADVATGGSPDASKPRDR